MYIPFQRWSILGYLNTITSFEFGFVGFDCVTMQMIPNNVLIFSGFGGRHSYGSVMGGIVLFQ